jgi:hypothetical protein
VRCKNYRRERKEEIVTEKDYFIFLSLS